MNPQYLPTLPLTWSIAPAKSLFEERKEVASETEPHLTPSQVYGVLTQADYMRVTGNRVVQVIEGGHNMKRVLPNDFIIHLRSFQGGIEHSAFSGRVSPAYTVLTPREATLPRYYRWVLKSAAYVQELRTTTNQLRDGQSIKFGQFASVRLPLPPRATQLAIADYLDRETVRIDTLIAKQEQLIATLRERRKSTIFETVFGRTWPDLAESTHAWLPPFPSHWEKAQLGFAVETLAGWAFPSEHFEITSGHTRLLRGVNIRPGATDWAETVYWDQTNHPVPPAYVLRAGDLVLGMDRPFVNGGVRVVSLTADDVPALLLQRVLRIRPNPSTHADYLRYLMMTDSFLAYLEPMFTGVSVPHISEWQVRKFVMPLPPLDEQLAIAEALEDRILKIDTLIAKAERFIALSKERRAALITAAVTGQIEVAAA